MKQALYIAAKEIGTTGINGTAHNKRVLQYFKDIGHSWVKDDETAWCAAFVNWVLLQLGRKGTGLLTARSFLTYGTPTTNPTLGDLVIFWRGAKSGPYGHVAFYLSHDKDYIYVLGGNQSNAVNVARYPQNRLLGYRKIPAKS